MFEEAGVARTERSVVNWCRPTAGGEPRLNSFFDPNERKHFITPESADRAIAEEIAKLNTMDRPQVTSHRGHTGAIREAPESQRTAFF